MGTAGSSSPAPSFTSIAIPGPTQPGITTDCKKFFVTPSSGKSLPCAAYSPFSLYTGISKAVREGYFTDLAAK